MEGASIAIIASAIEAASPNLRKLTNDLVATMISGKRILQTANKLVRHRLLSLKSNKKLRVSTTFNIEGKNANKTWEECLNNFPSPQVVKGLTITTETLVNIKRFSEDYDGEYFKVSSLLDYLRLNSSCEEDQPERRVILLSASILFERAECHLFVRGQSTVKGSGGHEEEGGGR